MSLHNLKGLMWILTNQKSFSILVVSSLSGCHSMASIECFVVVDVKFQFMDCLVLGLRHIYCSGCFFYWFRNHLVGFRYGKFNTCVVIGVFMYMKVCFGGGVWDWACVSFRSKDVLWLQFWRAIFLLHGIVEVFGQFLRFLGDVFLDEGAWER